MYAIIPHSVARKQKTQKPINPKKVIDPYASTYTHGDPTTRPKIDLHHNKLHARFRNADARTKDHFPLSKCTIDIIFFFGGNFGSSFHSPKTGSWWGRRGTWWTYSSRTDPFRIRGSVVVALVRIFSKRGSKNGAGLKKVEKRCREGDTTERSNDALATERIVRIGNLRGVWMVWVEWFLFLFVTYFLNGGIIVSLFWN